MSSCRTWRRARRRLGSRRRLRARIRAHRLHVSGYGRRVRTRRRRRTICSSRARSAGVDHRHENAPARVGISVADIAAGMYAILGHPDGAVRASDGGPREPRSTSHCSTRSANGWDSRPITRATDRRRLPEAARTTPQSRRTAVHRRGRRDRLSRHSERPANGPRFCADVLRRPDLAQDERFTTNALRVRNREALHFAIEAAFAPSTTSEVIERPRRRGGSRGPG
jgi:itaconate CoA-transferase